MAMKIHVIYVFYSESFWSFYDPLKMNINETIQIGNCVHNSHVKWFYADLMILRQWMGINSIGIYVNQGGWGARGIFAITIHFMSVIEFRIISLIINGKNIIGRWKYVRVVHKFRIVAFINNFYFKLTTGLSYINL